MTTSDSHKMVPKRQALGLIQQDVQSTMPKETSVLGRIYKVPNPIKAQTSNKS